MEATQKMKVAKHTSKPEQIEDILYEHNAKLFFDSYCLTLEYDGYKFAVKNINDNHPDDKLQ